MQTLFGKCVSGFSFGGFVKYMPKNWVCALILKVCRQLVAYCHTVKLTHILPLPKNLNSNFKFKYYFKIIYFIFACFFSSRIILYAWQTVFLTWYIETFFIDIFAFLILSRFCLFPIQGSWILLEVY